MRVLIFGSRDWADQFPIWCVLNGYASDGFGVTVINGGARGADSIAKQWADLHGEPSITVKADWAQRGKAAGPIRNGKMIALRPEVAWGFVTKPLPESRGSHDMATQLQTARIPCYIVTGSVTG